MPGTLVPAQMFDHELNPLKGWPSPYAVDHSMQVLSASDGIVPGMAIYKDPTTGKAKRGGANGYMPMWAFQGQNDFDVNGDVGNIISGVLTALVAIGSYELQTTEFVDDTYLPNDPLTVSLTADATLGKLKKTTLAAAVTICGIVSAAKQTNEYNKTFLSFWPCFLPTRA